MTLPRARRAMLCSAGRCMLSSLIAACSGASAPALKGSASDNGGAAHAAAVSVPESERWRKKQPAPGQPPAIVPPKFSQAKLLNGLTVVVSENPQLPTVTVSVVMRAGSAAEPRSKAGLADLSYELLLEGAGERNADELAEAFADLGTTTSVKSGADGARISAAVLSSNLQGAIALLADVVQRPRMREANFQRRKSSQLANLAQLSGHPRYLADLAFAPLVFGGPHPYGHLGKGTIHSVKALRLQDAKAFYKRHVGPKNTALVFAGDVSLETATNLAQEHFANWRHPVKAVRAPKRAPVRKRSSIILVPKTGLSQSVIVAGRPAVPSGHPDEWALRLANAVYGGLFGSRLNMNLREDKGYTYGARSRVEARRGTGPLVISTAVRADVTAPSVKELFNELEALVSRPITESEMQAAREATMRSLPGQFETNAGLAAAAARLYLGDLPLDRYQRMLAAYRDMNLQTVRSAARRYFTPSKIQLVLVGDPASIKKPVSALGIGRLVSEAGP
ncbi:MAG: insulinase family protein [Proteobacteria bacterium]|nr:insulinase family protein [Pseudomonadota bacterium]